MIIKVFRHGKGSGNAPIDYLLSHERPGRDKHPPQVLRGDAELTRMLINSIDNKWKYTAGVLSWHPDDKVPPTIEQQIMDDFEKLAFAGLETDQRDILWVRHSHAGHHELHFLIPRIELYNGKAFNPCPPGWQKAFDPLRDLYNHREGWARPDDPSRARFYTPEHAELHYSRVLRWGKMPKPDERAAAKQAIHDYLKQMIEQGLISNRDDVIQVLQTAGLEINRVGKDYITIKDSASNEKLRLKGGIYAQQWIFQQQPEQPGRTHESRNRAADASHRAENRATIARLEQELEQVIQKRAGYNRKRYPTTAYQLTAEHSPALPRHKPDIRQKMAANIVDKRQHSSGHHSGRVGIIHPGPKQDSKLVSGNNHTASSQSQDRAGLSTSGNQVQRYKFGPTGWQRLHSTPHGVQSGNRMANGQATSNTNNKRQINHDRNTAPDQRNPEQLAGRNSAETERPGSDFKRLPTHPNKFASGVQKIAGANSPDSQRAARIRSKLRTYERYTQELGTVVNKIKQNIRSREIRKGLER